MRLAVGFVVFALLLVVADTARSLSVTFDEVAHLGNGVAHIEQGRSELGIEHPPLPRLLAGAAAIAAGADGKPLAALRASPDPNVQWAHGERLVFHGRVPAARLLLAGRLALVGFPVLAALAAFGWARDRFGDRAGLVALGLVATWPDLLGHGAVVGNDVPLGALALAGAWATDRWVRDGKPLAAIAAGVCLGATVATKFSALPLVGALGLVGLARREAKGLLALVAALFVVALAYQDEPVTSVARGIERLIRLHGAAKPAPTLLPPALHFPASVVLKAPPGTLLLLALALVVALREKIRAARWTEVALHAPPLLLVATIVARAPLFGSRYLLAPLLFAFVSASRLGASRFMEGRGRLVVAAALAANVACVALEHPFHTNRTNVLAGSEPWRLLDGSCVDWGGGLRALGEWQRERGVERVLVVPTGASWTAPRREACPGIASERPWLAHLDAWDVRGEVRSVNEVFAPTTSATYAISLDVLAKARIIEDAGASHGGLASRHPDELVGGFAIFR